MQLVPGLTASFTIPIDQIAIISTDGGFSTNVTTVGAVSTADIALVIDGVTGFGQGYRRITSANVSGTGTNSIGTLWGMTVVKPLAAGTHTVWVGAAYLIGANSNVSGNNTNSRCGYLSITLINK